MAQLAPSMTRHIDTADVTHGPANRARICDCVQLSKAEAFDACQVLADADRCLAQAGRPSEAAALADLFELIEARLCDRAPFVDRGARISAEADAGP